MQLLKCLIWNFLPNVNGKTHLFYVLLHWAQCPYLKFPVSKRVLKRILPLNVYTKYSLNSYTVSLRFLRKKYAEKCFRIWKTYLVEKRMWLNKWVWKPMIFMGSTVYLGYLQYNWKGIKKHSVTFYFKKGHWVYNEYISSLSFFQITSWNVCIKVKLKLLFLKIAISKML